MNRDEAIRHLNGGRDVIFFSLTKTRAFFAVIEGDAPECSDSWWIEYSRADQLLKTLGPFIERKDAMKYAHVRGWRYIGT